MCRDISSKLQNFHLGELRTGCETRVVYETRWVEAGTGATPHTVIFSLALGKRQIQPCTHVSNTTHADTPPTECVTRESSTGRGFGCPYSLKFGYHTYNVIVGKFAGSEPWLVVIDRAYSDSGGAGES